MIRPKPNMSQTQLHVHADFAKMEYLRVLVGKASSPYQYAAMKIESIHIENFKVFKKATVKDIPQMAVLLGANGSGKTTFFDIFGFLGDALQSNVTIALNKRGGFHEVVSRGCDIDRDFIKFEIKFRNDSGSGEKNPVITYSIEIGFEKGKVYINRELLKYRRGQRGKPWHFLDFSRGMGYAVTNEDDYGKEGVEAQRIQQKVTSPDILAIKGLGQFEQFKAISNFRTLLEKWYVSNFKIEYGKNSPDVGISNHLSTAGENLAQVTKFMTTTGRFFKKSWRNFQNAFPALMALRPRRPRTEESYCASTTGISKTPLWHATCRTAPSKCLPS